ncbi:hypothetical protein LTR53_014044 [Teratosphaeriaceae sp. CCFEE 6253]|nr:hypothetical protein LTR53_014044 [Teratosphaeriaceae sp. CCFEE 6253]
MAALTPRPLFRTARFLPSHLRLYSTTPPAPPLLLKLRTDLKTAMRAKDAPRLDVLRALLADITNAAKTSTPIATDMQLLSLLRKRLTASQTAKAEFVGAGRQDLAEKEGLQGSVLEEYAGGVKVVGVERVREVVRAVAEEEGGDGGKGLGMGEVIKKLLGPGGRLEGENVDRAEVARVVKEVLAQGQEKA